MIKIFINYFLMASIIVGVVSIFSTFISKKGRDKSLIYLNLVVLFLILNYIQIILIDNVFLDANFFVTTLRIPFYALILPAYYTFVTYYLSVESKIKSFVLLSSLLFIAEMVARIILFQFYFNENYIVAQYRQIEEIINVLFSLFLFIKAYLLLFNRQKLYEYILTFDNLKWLKKFMLISCIIMFTWVIAIVFNLDKVIHPQFFIYYPLRFCCSILVFWLAYNGYFNYSLLSERIQLRKEIIKNEKVTNVNSLKDNIIDIQNDKFQIIKDHINNNNSYFNPTFSLENLSVELKMSTSSLSQIINKESKCNFSDYINSLRVEKAKEYLVSTDFKKYTILSIGLECGFNSKSTFYTSFKKFTGCTPSEFRLLNS